MEEDVKRYVEDLWDVLGKDGSTIIPSVRIITGYEPNVEERQRANFPRPPGYY